MPNQNSISFQDYQKIEENSVIASKQISRSPKKKYLIIVIFYFFVIFSLLFIIGLFRIISLLKLNNANFDPDFDINRYNLKKSTILKSTTKKDSINLTYRNPNLNFSFTYPNTWQIKTIRLKKAKNINKEKKNI